MPSAYIQLFCSILFVYINSLVYVLSIHRKFQNVFMSDMVSYMLTDQHFINLPSALLEVNVVFVRRPFRNKVNTCFCSQVSECAS